MYLIAEVGINANGNLDLAKQMIKKAALCGADAVKFQKRCIDKVYTKRFLDGPRDSPWGTTQREQKNGLEFSFTEYQAIDMLCKQIGIDWFASAWDFKSLEMMESFYPPYHKIASAFNCHIPFMTQVARYGRPVMLSTGMADMKQIETAVDVLRKNDCQDITLLHCVSIYPCPDELCNVRAVETLKHHFPDCKVGYSGHERGIVPSIMAVGFGAEVIERHFTLDRSSYGSDQSASLEPRGLARIAEYGKQVESCVGDGIIKVHPDELKCAKSLRYFLEDDKWSGKEMMQREG